MEVVWLEGRAGLSLESGRGWRKGRHGVYYYTEFLSAPEGACEKSKKSLRQAAGPMMLAGYIWAKWQRTSRDRSTRRPRIGVNRGVQSTPCPMRQENEAKYLRARNDNQVV